MISNIDGVARREVVLAVAPPLRGVAAELLDAQCWQWVADNTPELNHDGYAATEVTRQVLASRRALLKALDSLLGFRGSEASGVQWWHGGRLVQLPPKGKLSAFFSDISDELYSDAPRIHNELLNRRTLSSAASAARLRLVERMLTSTDLPFLGMDQGKAPPEKSMYLSVLSAGNVHREELGQLVIAEPSVQEDPLHLRPALTQIVRLLEQANGRRVEILDVLQGPPYGVRAGVAPLLLAITMVAHAHEVAIYENGTFLQKLDAHGFLRLTKQPSAFDVQLCQVVGVRMEVFRLLARIFAEEYSDDREYELLDVVRPLSVFAAQLPEYTRRKSNLEDPAKSVRDALLAAREPATLVFDSLPAACGLDPIPMNGTLPDGLGQRFVAELQSATLSLRDAYPQLLERIRHQVAVGLGDGDRPSDRVQTTHRASRISLAAVEPRLQGFARCLADSALADDTWAERVGSFVASKPPAQWTTSDENGAMNQLDILTAMFCRLEATVFDGEHNDPYVNAFRLGLTRSDGVEVAKVVRVRQEDEANVRQLAAGVEEVLTEANDLKLAAISSALWKILADSERRENLSPTTESPADSDSTGDRP